MYEERWMVDLDSLVNIKLKHQTANKQQEGVLPLCKAASLGGVIVIVVAILEHAQKCPILLHRLHKICFPYEWSLAFYKYYLLQNLLPEISSLIAL